MLQANNRHTARRGTRSTPRTVAQAILGLVLVLMISACADDADDRKFANDPRTPRATEPVTPRTSVAATPVGPAPVLASPETLVDRRGAPDRFYALMGDALWLVDGEGKRRIAEGPIPAFAASPGGDRVAVVTADTGSDGVAYGITYYGADGREEERVEDVLIVAADAATPVAISTAPDPVSLSWSPQGRRLLLAHAAGYLVDIPVEGSPETIETRASLTGITQADWSPRGDSIAVVVRDSDGRGSLALLDPEERPARLNVVAPVGADTSVQAFEWKPRGDGILFLEGAPDEVEGITRGTIVSWDRATNATQIVATGGTAGPTGSVRWFDIAPDGKAVAYSVAFLTNDGWVFNGLYVRSLTRGQTYQVPVAPDATVLQGWWLRDGLAWAATSVDPEREGEISILYVNGLGERRTVASIVPPAVATPAGSPGATPVEAVDATPVGTPGATPVSATPAASPAALGTPAATPVDAIPGATPDELRD